MNKKPKKIEMSYLSGLTVCKDEAVSLWCGQAEKALVTLRVG